MTSQCVTRHRSANATKSTFRNMKAVKFLKSGTPWGYGYNEGENGLVKPEHFDELKAAGVVEAIDMAEAVKLPHQKREKRG